MSDLVDPKFLEQTAEELYENAPCGYVSTLLDGTIVKLNRTFSGWTGYAPAELVGRRRFQQLLSVAGRFYHETHLRPLLLTAGAVRQVALELLCATGDRLPVLVNFALHKDANGLARIIRLTLLNARQRRAYERELVAERRRAEESARIKADFLSTISHEIRTPLGAIMGVTHLLERSGPNARQAKLLRIQRSSSENLLNLVNEILDFSKIEAGQVELDPRVFSLRDLIYETASRLEVQTKAEVELIADVDAALAPWLVGDPGKLGQVLTNLLGNAIKFTRAGHVCVSARQRALADGRCTFEVAVTDTGIGIPADRLSTIFDAFTQASADTSLRYGGTGLGLAISQSLLGLHGSQLEVQSSPGHGSRFAFELTLPVATDPPAAVDPPRLAERVRGVRVLVAEDNPVNVYVLSRCLEDWGVDFDVVGDGRAAVERVRDGDYDLVLMDLRMPEMDGYEATRAIRTLPDLRFVELPIIAVSATVRIGEQDKVAVTGFTDFLSKPYQPNVLLERIARFGGEGRAPAASQGPAPEFDGLVEFSIEHLRAHAEDDTAAAELFDFVADSLRTLRARLGAALEAQDLERYAIHARHGQGAIGLLRASTLHAAVERGRRLLGDQAPASDLAAARRAIEWSVDDVLAAMAADAN